MKLKTYLLGVCLALLSCKPKEQVVETYPNGNPQKVEYRDSEGRLLAVQNYYINNIRKEKFEVQNGLAHGEYQAWNLSGGLLESGQMQKGERSGEWTVWYDSKTPHQKGTYQKGQKEGLWQEFWYEGELRSKVFFKAGDTTGLEEHFAKSGQVIFKSSCHDQNKAGMRQTFSLSGIELKREECLGQQKHGEYLEWDEEGDLMLKGQYFKGLKDKQWISYRKFAKGDTEVRRIENYDQGKREGYQFAKSPKGVTLLDTVLEAGTGVLKYACEQNFFCPETSFVDGLIHGEVKSRTKSMFRIDRFEKGRLIQSRWFEFKGGDETRPKPDQLELSAEGFFKNGKKDSVWKSYYSGGKVHSLQTYKDGELFGLEQNYDSLGNLSIEKIHQGKNMPLVVNFK